MGTLQAVGHFLLDLLIYLVNGLLEVLYQIVDHWAVLAGLLCGLAVLLIFDVLTQRLAATAPARQGQKPHLQVSRHHQLLSGITILAWLVVGLAFPTPVPQLGAAMWGLTILALLLMPAEQVSILWRSKVAILSYCGLLVAFRVVAAWTLAADPREWASIVGTMGEAQRVVASSRGLVLTIASYVSWFAIPAGYVVYLFQKATTHPMSLRNPLARASEVAWQIRQRPD
jgi:hypothetical protein